MTVKELTGVLSSIELVRITKGRGGKYERSKDDLYRLAGRAESKPGAYKTGDMERRSKALCSSAGH